MPRGCTPRLRPLLIQSISSYEESVGRESSALPSPDTTTAPLCRPLSMEALHVCEPFLSGDELHLVRPRLTPPRTKSNRKSRIVSWDVLCEQIFSRVRSKFIGSEQRREQTSRRVTKRHHFPIGVARTGGGMAADQTE